MPAMSASTPTAVSLCVAVTASNSPSSSVRRTASRAMTSPGSAARRTTLRPQASAIRAKRSPKSPCTMDSTLRRVPLRMASSIADVPDPVTTWTGRRVPKIGASRAVTRRMSSSIAGLRWKIMGRRMASRISGRTSVGPGTKNVPASIRDEEEFCFPSRRFWLTVLYRAAWPQPKSMNQTTN